MGGGRKLDERLASGSLPLEEALVVARQIAAALDDIGPDGSIWVIRRPVIGPSDSQVDLILGWDP